MNLESHYNKLYESSIKKISNDEYTIDNLIDSPQDKRFGVTLLIRPSLEVKNEIQKFLRKLKACEPNQYYYDSSDIHITVMSIISCYDGFKLENTCLSKYIDIINKSLVNTPCNLEISFKGITASPSCIMIQGFMNNETLKNTRHNLRHNFKNSTLEQSLDKRYAIQTAHATVVRFKNKLTDKNLFLELLNKYKNYNFGSFKVDALEFVYNDWYQKKEHVKTLSKFHL